MIDLIISHWKEIISVLSFVGVGKLFVDSRIKKANIKKEEALAEQEDIQVKVSEANYTQITQDIYKNLAIDLKADREFLKEENARIREESKSEKIYFRKELDDLRRQSSLMQQQLNEITLSYAKEVEISQNWEKLHSELKEKFTILENEYTDLKKAHDKLKQDFDTYKKQNK